MSHQEHFFVEYMPAVFTLPKSSVLEQLSDSNISLEAKPEVRFCYSIQELAIEYATIASPSL